MDFFRNLRVHRSGPLVVALLVVCVSCAQNGGAILERQTQFQLDIGKMEDQIDLLLLPGEAFQQKVGISMRNGLFYVSNGASGKVMVFSSYGDLISLYYNEAVNPAPVLLNTAVEDGRTASRRAYTHPFREVGVVAVTSGGDVLVEDGVSEGREEYDPEIGALLSRVILRFDREGNYLGYLGQDGLNGIPFSYIDGISVNQRDEIIVVCRSLQYWLVYWFSPEGMHMYTLRLAEDALPSEQEGYIPTLDALFPDPEEPVVYTKVDYYLETPDNSASESGTVEFTKSSTYWFDIRTASFGGPVDLPPALFASGSPTLFNRNESEVLRLFLGVASGGYLFFLSPASQNIYELLVIHRGGMVIHKTGVELIDEDTIYRTFFVDPEGILTALIAKEGGVEIALWRTDNLLKRVEYENS